MMKRTMPLSFDMPLMTCGKSRGESILEDLLSFVGKSNLCSVVGVYDERRYS